MRKQAYHFGIDFLRILAMLMIVITHVLAQGGIRKGVAGEMDAQYVITWLMQIAVYGAVNCYAMISGYVGANSRFRYSRLASLWLQVAFYTISITVLFFLAGKSLSWMDWAGAFLPIFTSQYWYVTAYFGLLLLIPILNVVLQHMPTRELGLILGALLLYFCLLPALFNNPVEGFSLNEGYSTIWLAILYLLGAYLKRLQLEKWPSNRHLLLIYVISVGLTFLLKEVVGNIWFWYTSPTIFINSLSIFVIFARMDVSSEKLRKFIRFVAPATLGIYLIHLHPLVVRFLLRGVAKPFLSQPVYLLPVMVIIAAVMIFAIALPIEKGRLWLFSYFKVSRRITKVDSPLLQDK